MPRRPLRHAKQPPLPQRNGIDPVHFHLPDPLPEEFAGVETIADFLIARFYPEQPELIFSRYERGEMLDDDGAALAPNAPYEPGKGLWYYRELPHEEPLSDDLPVLFEDEHVLAIDKPHFLPTTPRGSYVAQTALTKLRVRENNPLLIPIHRLDRPTAGVLLFAKTREARAPFQTMFQKRGVEKSYLAVCPALPDLKPGESLDVKGRIDKNRDELQVRFLAENQAHEQNLEPNSHSTVQCVKTWANAVLPPENPANKELRFPAENEKIALYRLTPHTGKTHQLRAHMNHLGAPIWGDIQYPHILGINPDEPALPLQLLAQTLSFNHPITGENIYIESKRTLALLESAPAQQVQ